MFRALLIAVVAVAVLSACSQTVGNADYGRGSAYRHADGLGPSFSSRILP